LTSQECSAQGSPFGDRHNIHRQRSAVSQRLDPGVVTRAAASGHDSPHGYAREVEVMANDESGSLDGRPPQRCGVMGEIELV
jgi:hypothetical protein